MTEEALTPLDVLRRDGWTKRHMCDEDGQRCILGAWVAASSLSPSLNDIGAVIREQYRDRCQWGDDSNGVIVTQFNDHAATTFADVEKVLEKAQIRLDEQVQS